MTRDRIILKGMRFSGHLGTSEAERRRAREYTMDIEMTADLKKAGRSDSLSRTLNYKRVYELIKKIQDNGKYHLLEALAENTASALLKEFDKIREITVKVRKPRPPVGGLMEYAEVEINRKRKSSMIR